LIRGQGRALRRRRQRSSSSSLTPSLARQKQGQTSKQVRCREAVRARPDDPDAWRGLGVALLLRVSSPRAPDVAAAAASSKPDEEERKGVAREAARCLRRTLQLRPSSVSARHALGLALLRAGDPRAAAEHLERACALRPADSRLRSDLAGALRACGRPAAAAEAYRAAISALEASERAGISGDQGGGGGESRESGGESAPAGAPHPPLNPLPPPSPPPPPNPPTNPPPLHYRLAMALRETMASPAGRGLGRGTRLAREARRCLARQLALTPGHALSAFWLAALAAEAGDGGDEGDKGDEGEAAAALAAATDASKQGCPPAMVAALFDKYAPSFDEHLVGELGYATPRRLAAALSEAAAAAAANGGGGRNGAFAGFRRVADLGVGTGLMGPLLRPLMAAAGGGAEAGAQPPPLLCGVDLSAGMVARARRGGCYDALDVGELVGWLRARAPGAALAEGAEGGGGGDGSGDESGGGAAAAACPRAPPPPFDALVAADVLVYFGDLAPVMGAAASCAAAGALFALSTECDEEQEEEQEEEGTGGAARARGGGGGGRASGAGFRLRATGRFAHAASYVEARAREAGWAVASLERGSPLRMNAGRQVLGDLFVLRKL